jgi:hypothetical protein
VSELLIANFILFVTLNEELNQLLMQHSSFVPIDPVALQHAANKVAGDIAMFASACSIGTLRQLSRMMIQATSGIK